MLYSDNVLPLVADNWTLSSASLINGNINIFAGGHATIAITAMQGVNETPSALMLSVRATNYAGSDTYSPKAFVCVEIIYEDGSIFYTSVPVIDVDDGLVTEVILQDKPTDNIVPFSVINYTIKSSIDIVINQFSLQKSMTDIVTENKDYYGASWSRDYGIKVTRSDGNGEVILNSDVFTMRSKFGGTMIDRIYFDPITGNYVFTGNIHVNGGSIDIGGNFIVDSQGNVTMSGAAKISGAAEIYSGKFYAGTQGSTQGYSEMTQTGFNISSTTGLKVKLGYTDGSLDYPFLALGQGDGTPNSRGFVKKFTDGLWIGNSAPEQYNGTFVARTGYNGIFFSFVDNMAYVVNGTSKVNIYTGDAVAKFG